MSKKKSIESAEVVKAEKASKATKKKLETKTAASAAEVAASPKPSTLKKPVVNAAKAPAAESATDVVTGAVVAKPAPQVKAAGDLVGKARAKPKVNGAAIVEPSPITQDEIARLAYSYAEARGFHGGSPEDDWTRAEQELRSIRGL